MRLYMLAPVDEKNYAWVPWHDKCFGMVIRAKDSKQARRVASENAGGEDSAVWLDPTLTRCRTIDGSGRAGVLVRDIHSA